MECETVKLGKEPARALQHVLKKLLCLVKIDFTNIGVTDRRPAPGRRKKDINTRWNICRKK
jgi:hypothetical protein